MIKNSKQAVTAKENLKNLLKDKQFYLDSEIDHNNLKSQLAIETFDSLIYELSKEIDEYETLINESYHCIKNKCIDDLGEVLISCRLAQRYSQRDIAKAIGIDEQQIQRYEVNNYESASLYRIQEVAEALNISLAFKNIEILGKQINFKLPKDIDEEKLVCAENFTKNHGSLVFNL